jgi:hypothetical protein
MGPNPFPSVQPMKKNHKEARNQTTMRRITFKQVKEDMQWQ